MRSVNGMNYKIAETPTSQLVHLLQERLHPDAQILYQDSPQAILALLTELDKIRVPTHRKILLLDSSLGAEGRHGFPGCQDFSSN